MFSFWKRKKKTSEKREPGSKIQRISRLVSDLNSKRESLVQTGFPTSIADLVVNSRVNWIPPIHEQKKLSKKSSKKPSTKETRPPFLNPPAFHIPTPVVELEPHNPSEVESGSGQLPIEEQLTERRSSLSGETDEDLLLLRKKLKVICLVCLISVLAFVTKKITLGITVSVFCLLLLEYVKENFFHSSKPCTAGSLKSKNEGSSHRSTAAFRQIHVRHGKTISFESKRDDSVALLHNAEILRYDPPGKRRNVNQNYHSLESGRNKPISLKQVSMVQAEDHAGVKVQKMNLKRSLKIKILRRFSRFGYSSKDGNGDEISPLADGIPGSECGQETNTVAEEKQLFLEEKDLLFSTENDLQFGTERSDIKGDLSMISNLSLENLIFVCVILSGLLGSRLFALVSTTTWYLLAKFIQRKLVKQK